MYMMLPLLPNKAVVMFGIHVRIDVFYGAAQVQERERKRGHSVSNWHDGNTY